MGKTYEFLQIYKKIYGGEVPTPEKIKNTKLITGILRDVYQIAKSDSLSRNWRPAELVALIKRSYNTPGEVQKWLVDSVKAVYESGYKEGRG